MNRGDDDEVYATNVGLARQLVEALQSIGRTPHVIYSSSTHEDRETAYGRSKKDARKILEKWAKEQGATLTVLVIPNVYGPFCRPNYNSVVATFSHQLVHGETPRIHVDQSLNLVYIDDLLKHIDKAITDDGPRTIKVPATGKTTVSGLLSKLTSFKETYLDEGVIPPLSDWFETSLFNTFRSYMEPDRLQRTVDVKADDRGHLYEAVRAQTQGQVFYSSTRQGVTRGDHYHRRKVERFIIIKGRAHIKLRQMSSDKVIEYTMDGDRPSYIDIPVLHTHNITNIGEAELQMLFWTNELFDPSDPDTYHEKVATEQVLRPEERYLEVSR